MIHLSTPYHTNIVTKHTFSLSGVLVAPADLLAPVPADDGNVVAPVVVFARGAAGAATGGTGVGTPRGAVVPEEIKLNQ